MTEPYPFPTSADEFTDKRVLVTGGTRGIGAAVVRRFRQLTTAQEVSQLQQRLSNLCMRRLLEGSKTGSVESDMAAK